MAWKNPTPTVDVVIHIEDADGIVLIRRKNPPVGWALPGGFVDEGERVESAAVREALEETGLHVTLDELLYVYSDPARDPRKHTMSVVFTGHAQGSPVGEDDAAEARVFSTAELQAAIRGQGVPLVFDHARILADYLVFASSGRRPSPGRFLE